jgi:type II secretory ATPase GspE/PulE/Tfp pilus assembly ATPase PilB-like protein
VSHGEGAHRPGEREAPRATEAIARAPELVPVDDMTQDALREAAAGELASRFPARYLEEQLLLPVAVAKDGVLVVAAGRPLDVTVTDELVRRFGRPLRIVDVPPQELQAALMGAGRNGELVGDGGTGPLAAAGGEDLGLGDLRAQANDAPVVQLVNAVLSDALRTGASDVHLECTRTGLRLRLRLDGVLRDVASYPPSLQAGVVSRIKLLAGLDIAERRLPQDGRARVRLASREVDLRVSTLPALHGESVVLRILDQGDGATGVRDLAALGMPATVRAQFEPLVARASGLLLVTGPTGSGKTTTLYAALAQRNEASVKIVTVEDPVEYQVAGVTQIPVNRKAGLGFANVLRSILRHDPDIVMVGEMRDRETAEMAIQSALTGHLVLSTLHTNDATSAITRLVDMGIEPYLVAATVQGVLAQRLVRVTCRDCAAPIADADPAFAGLGGPHLHRDGWQGARRGAGCPACGGTGFRGRTGIYELYVPTERDRRHIAATGSLEGMRPAGGSYVLMSLRESGEALVRAGVTPPEEVQRVLGVDDSPERLEALPVRRQPPSPDGQ